MASDADYLYALELQNMLNDEGEEDVVSTVRRIIFILTPIRIGSPDSRRQKAQARRFERHPEHRSSRVGSGRPHTRHPLPVRRIRRQILSRKTEMRRAGVEQADVPMCGHMLPAAQQARNVGDDSAERAAAQTANSAEPDRNAAGALKS